MYRMEGCAGVIMEDNVMRGGGLNTYGKAGSRRTIQKLPKVGMQYRLASRILRCMHNMLHYAGLYFANNDVATVMGGDRELLSFDGGGGAYNGSVSATSADGRTLTLSGDPVYAGYIPPVHAYGIIRQQPSSSFRAWVQVHVHGLLMLWC